MRYCLNFIKKTPPNGVVVSVIFGIENHRNPSHYDLHIENFNSDKLKFSIEYQYKEMQERKLSLRTRLGAGTGFVKDNFSLCPLMRGFSACRTKCFYSSCVLLPISYYQRQFLQYQQNKKWAAPVRLQMLPIEIML